MEEEAVLTCNYVEFTLCVDKITVECKLCSIHDSKSTLNWRYENLILRKHTVVVRMSTYQIHLWTSGH